MTTPVGALARLTIATPARRIDVALAEDVPLAELLPHILRHAGENVADDGERHGGWALYRSTGGALDAGQPLNVQGVRDGDVLHLRARRMAWPELEYDDVVEAIASGARRYGRTWGNVATRRCAIAVMCVFLALGLPAIALTASPLGGGTAIAVGVGVLIVGVALARAGADAKAGAFVAAWAMPYALLGGAVVATPAQLTITGLGAPHLLLGSSCLLVAALAGYFGTASVGRLFTAGIFVGTIGLIGSLVALTMSAAGAASIAVTIALGLLPGYPILSIRLGKLPIPELPRKAEDLLKDQPVPPRNTVFEAVVRADEILTGLLIGVAVVSVTATMWMLTDGGTAAVVLTVEVVLALLLRARLFPTARQRIPLIVAALAAVVLLAVGFARTVGPGARLIEVVVLVVVAASVLSAGLLYSRRPPSPYMGRFADIIDVLAIIALIPTAGVVTGLYKVIQAMLAGVGG